MSGSRVRFNIRGWQVSVNLLPLVVAVYTSELRLTLPMLSWHSVVAARCQEPLNFISFGASSIPPLQRIRVLPFQRPGQTMCAFVLRDVCKSWTSGNTPVDFRSHDICSDCFHLLHAAQIRAGTHIARSTALRQTSSTVMLPQVAGLIVHASRCTQRWLVHATPVVITFALTTLGVFDDSVLNSPRAVWQLHLCSRSNNVSLERCETDHCVVTCAKSVTMALHGNVDHCQLFDAKSHSHHWENTCRSI